MIVLEYVLLAILLLAAIFIVTAVLLQKGNEDGLSGAISGGSETFYGKDKSSHTDRLLFKWTAIVGVIFVVCVVVVYVIQPDYSSSFSLDDWMSDYLNQYSNVFLEITE